MFRPKVTAWQCCVRKERSFLSSSGASIQFCSPGKYWSDNNTLSCTTFPLWFFFTHLLQRISSIKILDISYLYIVLQRYFSCGFLMSYPNCLRVQLYQHLQLADILIPINRAIIGKLISQGLRSHSCYFQIHILFICTSTYSSQAYILKLIATRRPSHHYLTKRQSNRDVSRCSGFLYYPQQEFHTAVTTIIPKFKLE